MCTYYTDAELEELSLDGGISIPAESMDKMNRTAGLDRQMTSSGNYAGFLEVFHHIHCLVCNSATFCWEYWFSTDCS
jgi:hypothetical protein